MKRLFILSISFSLFIVFTSFVHLAKHPIPTEFPPSDGNEVDKCVNNKLHELHIEPSNLCSDEVFVRRLYLNLTGRIPTAETARHFITLVDNQKRGKLIDQLLESDEYVDFQVLKWGDLLRCKSEFPSDLWPNGVQAYSRFMRESIRANLPYDQFARKLLISSGSNFKNPEVNFYCAFQERTPQNIAEAVALIFLGTRPKQLHESKQDYSIFFSQLKYKKNDEWKEEIVYADKDKLPASAKFTFGNDSPVTLSPNSDLRNVFADWLTSKQNPLFAKVIVNRIWFWLLGKGIVDEPDDFREGNAPLNPALLSYLEKELISSNYNLRHIFRIILNSQAFQRSALPNKSNSNDATLFSHYQIRRLGAEQLIDAICDITGVPETYMSRVPEPFTFLPSDFRAVQLEDGTISTAFLEMFGRPSRDVSYESDRINNLTDKQVLILLNSTQISDKIARSKSLKELATSKKTDAELIENIYLQTLSRFPVSEEKKKLELLFKDKKMTREQNVNDLVWALINTKEFIFNH
jgi:hypothetical protein